MSKHTQGPWEPTFNTACKPEFAWGVCAAGGGDVLGDGMSEANARLMAASTELLEACYTALEALAGIEGHTEFRYPNAKATLKAAIAKAEGR